MARLAIRPSIGWDPKRDPPHRGGLYRSTEAFLSSEGGPPNSKPGQDGAVSGSSAAAPRPGPPLDQIAHLKASIRPVRCGAPGASTSPRRRATQGHAGVAAASRRACRRGRRGPARRRGKSIPGTLCQPWTWQGPRPLARVPSSASSTTRPSPSTHEALEEGWRAPLPVRRPAKKNNTKIKIKSMTLVGIFQGFRRAAAHCRPPPPLPRAALAFHVS